MSSFDLVVKTMAHILLVDSVALQQDPLLKARVSDHQPNRRGNRSELLLTNVSGVGGSLMRAQPDSVKKYPILLPPFNEQKRIADKINQLFSMLDSITEFLN